MPGDAADQSGGDADSDGGRSEVVNGQCDHLREIRHRRLTTVALPIGVGGEACGGVEGEVRGKPGQRLRVERQMVLETQDEVGEDHSDQTEREQSEGITDPALFAAGIDAADPVGQSLDRTNQAIEPGLAVDVEDLHEVQAKRFGDEQKRAYEERELKPGIR